MGSGKEIESGCPQELDQNGQGDTKPPSKSMVCPAQSGPSLAKPLLQPDDPACFRHEIGNSLAIMQLTMAMFRREIETALSDSDEVLEIKQAVVEDFLSNFDSYLKQAIGLCDKEKCQRMVETASTGSIVPPESIEIELERMNISEVLDAQVKLWRRVKRKNIEISKYIESGVFLMADKFSLMQIFANVWFNAYQSMQSVPERKNRMIVRLQREGESCRILIEDNGAGIRKEHESMLFQPGFTTKKNGNGIGLSVCLKKTTEIGGTFSIANGSEMGEGATVMMEFPIISDEEEKLRRLEASRQLCLDFNPKKGSK